MKRAGPRFVESRYVVRRSGSIGGMQTHLPHLALAQVVHLRENFPGETISVTYYEACNACRGAGRVATRTRFKFVTCKVCSGEPFTEETSISESELL